MKFENPIFWLADFERLRYIGDDVNQKGNAYFGIRNYIVSYLSIKKKRYNKVARYYFETSSAFVHYFD